MDKKNQVLLTVIAVATLLVAVIGATFAYFSATVYENNKTTTKLKAAELGIKFEGTQEITTDCSTGLNAGTGTATEGGNTYTCVSGSSWEPGTSAHKLFTVENTSDYDMTFDINWTNVVNNFERTQDLTYSISASFVSGAPTGDSNVKMVNMSAANSDSVANSTKANFSVSGTLPTGGTVDNTNPASPVITPSTATERIVRVFIPKHSKQSFDILVTYVDAVDSTTGERIDQNMDQGKIFRTTVNITSNGIDAGSLKG